ARTRSRLARSASRISGANGAAINKRIESARFAVQDSLSMKGAKRPFRAPAGFWAYLSFWKGRIDDGEERAGANGRCARKFPNTAGLRHQPDSSTGPAS